jgi:hypothetical protein
VCLMARSFLPILRGLKFVEQGQGCGQAVL